MSKKIFKGIGKIAKVATMGIVGNTIFDAIKGGKKKKAAPAEAGPKVMPLADDEAVKRARKISMLQQIGRGGRTSTMLSDDTDTLGG